MIFRMCADIKFNRPINAEKDYISPGGYEIKTNGKTVQFDFEDYEGSVSKEDARVLSSLQKNPDFASFDDLKSLTEDDLRNISEIVDFYVYTGEDDESDLEPVEIINVSFSVLSDASSEWKDIDVPKYVIDAYNKKIAETR